MYYIESRVINSYHKLYTLETNSRTIMYNTSRHVMSLVCELILTQDYDNLSRVINEMMIIVLMYMCVILI